MRVSPCRKIMDGKSLAEQFLTRFYNDTVFTTRPLVQDILKKITESMPADTILTDENISEALKIIGGKNKEIASQILEFEKLGETIKKSLVTDRGL